MGCWTEFWISLISTGLSSALSVNHLAMEPPNFSKPKFPGQGTNGSWLLHHRVSRLPPHIPLYPGKSDTKEQGKLIHSGAIEWAWWEGTAWRGWGEHHCLGRHGKSSLDVKKVEGACSFCWYWIIEGLRKLRSLGEGEGREEVNFLSSLW